MKYIGFGAVLAAWTLPFVFGATGWDLSSCLLLWFVLFFPGLWIVLRATGRNPFSNDYGDSEPVEVDGGEDPGKSGPRA